MTYTALASLLILGDDLSQIDRKGIQEHIKSLQCEDGSFYSTVGGSENDMRFVYCAATVCYILQDFSAINVESAVKYIIKSISFEGGLGQGPRQESHGGSTFCGVAALHLMNRMDALSTSQRKRLIEWLVFRQHSEEGGLQGRPNKPADTCYSFWVGATLKLLDSFHYLDHKPLIQFVLSTQDPIIGGLGKFAGIHPDGLHTYLGISGLALMDTQITGIELRAVDPALNISQRALQHLSNLHKTWLLNS
ncbi:UNVERIFIED_CONTAM: hypothetical protein GTU68_055290 [Idotea baltica]|nr:hypothetical protein [Idotea baltica]